MSQIWECTQKKYFPENFGKCKEKILQGDLVTVKLKKKQNHQQTLTSRFSHIVGNKAKGRISKRVFQENKARQIFRKTNISCVSGGKKCSFFGKFGVLCFLETPVLRFALLPNYRRYNSENEFVKTMIDFLYFLYGRK